MTREHAEMSAVGRPTERADALEKVLGRPIFTADLIPHDALYIALVRSTRPHAKILEISAEAALRMKGVIRLIGKADIPGVNNIGCIIPDRLLFSDEIVRCVGDPICSVLAKDRKAAEDGARAVDIEYQDLAAVFSPFEAMRPEAIKIHPQGNVCKHLKIRRGNVEKGFRDSDVIVENEFRTSMQEHAPLEPDVAFAMPPDQHGIVAVVGPWQCAFEVQDSVALALSLQPDKVKVLQVQGGGAFGSRSDETENGLSALTALAACISGKPVAILMSREESSMSHAKRHVFFMKYKTGAKRDGTLVAEEIEIVSDTGAYVSWGINVLKRAIVHCTGPYVIPNVRADAYCVYTNNPYASAFRGFGCPQVHFAAESQMNCLAEALSIGPIVLRKKNLLRPSSCTSTGQILGKSVGLEKCLTTVVDSLQSMAPSQSEPGHGRGFGIAVGYHGNSLGPEGGDRCGATMILRVDGHVEYMIGLSEYGTGSRFGHAQIIAETLGLTMDRVHVKFADTLAVPYSGPTVASRSTVMGGNAALLVSRRLRETLGKVAAEVLSCAVEEVEFANNLVCSSRDSTKTISLEQLASICRQKGIDLCHSQTYRAPETDWNEDTGQGSPYFDYTFGAIGAIVDVNMQTGYPKVQKIVSTFDCGKVINPLSATGQVEGAIVQGLGYAIMEEVCTKDGKIVNPNLADYFVCTTIDSPQIETVFVEDYPSGFGPFGAKCIAEPPLDIVAPAVVQAIWEATGVRIKDLPATGEKILLELERTAGNR
ncbi:xanthine dehydrogenase family protein molybdopterin-binding subunit [[Eubacterium] cellulosolvens]